MGVTSMALHVQKPIGEIEFRNLPEAQFAVARFADGGYIHFAYNVPDGASVLEVIKDFCQALIGAAETEEGI